MSPRHSPHHDRGAESLSTQSVRRLEAVAADAGIDPDDLVERLAESLEEESSRRPSTGSDLPDLSSAEPDGRTEADQLAQSVMNVSDMRRAEKMERSPVEHVRETYDVDPVEYLHLDRGEAEGELLERVRRAKASEGER